MHSFLILFSLLILPFNLFSEGRLIEVCGIDGSGKSTFIQDLQNALTGRGRKVIVLKPLSGEPLFCKFLDELDTLKAVTTELELHSRIDRFKSDFFFLGMLNHRIVIDRYISEGYDVLCDRYIFSYKTYQECFDQEVKEDEALISLLPKENMTFLLITPIEVAMKRIETKGIPASYENPAFLRRAQEIFLTKAGAYPHLVYLNGNGVRQFNIDTALVALGEQ